MSKSSLIAVFFIVLLMPGLIFGQGKPVFSGDPAKFKDELIQFMGPDLAPDQKTNLYSFISKWDSAAFSKINMIRILDLSSQLTGRQMRAVPHFSEFIKTLIDFCTYRRDDAFLSYWLTGMSEMLFNPRYSNESISRYIQNTSLLIKENLLINSGSVKWKVKNIDLKFSHDTVFQVTVTDGTLTCYSQRDSTEIFHAYGTFFPDIHIFHGTKGIVTWEKAGFPAKDVYAELSDYTINTTRNMFSCDSAKFFHKTYFKKPELGILTDQAATIPVKEKATYPQFETYTKQFKIKNLYKGVNYEGGLAFEGAQTKGKGSRSNGAKITLYRNDTLFVKVVSDEFVFSKTSLNSHETAVTLYLKNDSIYHSNLGFSYNSATREVNLFRANNPVSESPYYDSYHNIDMYFENLSWNMNGSKIIISRAKGASLGEAKFESSSFFNSDYFMSLMNLDNYNPLTQLKKFSDWYYSETFPVSEFARWLNKSDEYVIGLCIDMANRGFIFYDRTFNEVTIKKKVKDFIDSYAGKKDYDALSVYSETKAPLDNAVLDLNNFNLTVRGVTGVHLSDTQKVAVFPYNRELTIEKNRNFKFDGVIKAGLFTIYGHDFHFIYDSFKIKLQRIDSILVEVETQEKDPYGKPRTQRIDNLIQLVKGELFIDDPKNKSGLKNLTQYPIINATAASYIFYDKIPGLENVYKTKDFYFKVDPFRFENIDHYSAKDLSLSGEFFGGSILKPMRQFLTIQDNNSLGFQMDIPEEGIDVYDGKGKFYKFISMSNKGLIGNGMLKHLTAQAKSQEFKFFPDSMITLADTFFISRDEANLFPDLNSQDVRIKWLPGTDKWLAVNSKDKNFNLFGNGTQLDGNLILSVNKLSGSGIINMPDSRINSNSFTFSSDEIKADTADYNLKSPSTNGYAFLTENVNADINFALKSARFHLNTGSSLVRFPEIQYNCTMTDFEYKMDERILYMEQKGKAAEGLLPVDKLLRLNFMALAKPTFFATNNLRDTIAFTSLSAKYNVEKEFIEADNIDYIHIADALIQPENGKIIINRRAKIEKLQNARIAVNNLHLLHSANIEIESTKNYFGSAVYDYIDDGNEIQPISFPDVRVDTMTTSAKGFIAADQKFKLSPAFSFTGDVNLYARSKNLLFTGSVGTIHDCNQIISYPVKFKSFIDPKNVMIPISEKPRDNNDNLLCSGSVINIDSAHLYPAFLSPLKSWTDVVIVNANGVLFYNKAKGEYQISPPEKVADPAQNGNMVTLNRVSCVLKSEGNINLGTNFGRLKMGSAGNVVHTLDSGKVDLRVILALDFYFSPEALKVMSEEIRITPSLKPVNMNSEFNNKAMKDLFGSGIASQLKEEIDLFGISKNMPKEFTSELLLNDVKLFWNEATASFRSKDKIGIGFIGTQPVNLYVDGYIEIQRRRSGDLIDIYLKANNNTWYYFSYLQGIMMARGMNENFNSIISSAKPKERKDPGSSAREPYSYVIAANDRMSKFIKRMSEESADDPSNLDRLFK